MRILLFISLFVVDTSFEMVHDIHVSILEIDARKDEPVITVKTFLDDLQLATGLIPGEELPEDYSSSDELIADYISKTIQLNSEGQLIPISIERIDASMDAVWITLRINDTSEWQKVKLANSFMTELYDDQKNLVKVITPTGRNTYALDAKKSIVEIEFIK